MSDTQRPHQQQPAAPPPPQSREEEEEEEERAHDRQQSAHDHHLQKLEAADKRRSEIQSENIELLKASNDLDSRLQGAQEKHNRVLAEQQQSAERDARQHHLKELDAAEDRRIRAQAVERSEDMQEPNYSVDASLARAFEKQTALAAEQTEHALKDLEEHNRGLEEAEARRESLRTASLESLKEHNDLDRKVEQAQKKHVETLRDQQHALAKDLHAHELGHRGAEERRASLQQAQLERVISINRLDEKIERAQEKFHQLQAEEMNRKLRDAREHQAELAAAEERREQARRASLEHIKQFNALDEKLSTTQEKHQQILEQRQRELERDVQAHNRGLNSADERRQNTPERGNNEAAANTQAKLNRALERYDRLEADRQEAMERDFKSHMQSLDTAEQRRALHAAESLERLKQANSKSLHTLEVRDRIQAEEECRKEEDAMKHERANLQSAERRRESYTASSGSLTDKRRADGVPRSALDSRAGNTQNGSGVKLAAEDESSVRV